MGAYEECPSTYCEELDSYVAGNGVLVAAVGNDRECTKTEYPACSWLTVGVGGVEGKESDGDAILKDTVSSWDRSSQYGTISFKNLNDGTTYCPWCYNRSGTFASFTPDVYSVGVISTDADKRISGTSYAAPQVAASAMIDHADGGIRTYTDALNRFVDMNARNVVDQNSSKDPSRNGEQMNANYYF